MSLRFVCISGIGVFFLENVAFFNVVALALVFNYSKIALAETFPCLSSCRLGFLIAYVSKVEREFWALAEGPWSSEPGGGMQYRARWAASIRSANGPTDLAQSILQLESVLRPIAFTPSWFGEEGTDGAAHTGGATPQPGSRVISRATSMADLHPAGGSQAALETGDDDYGIGGSQARDRSTSGADPYDIRFEKLIVGGWEMDRRSHAAHAAGVNRLPRSLLKKVRFK